MKFIILIVLVPIISFSQINESTTGEWIKKGKGYEYKLRILQLDSNLYEFEFEGWHKAYDHFINDTTVFSGSIEGVGYIFIKEGNLGIYDDIGRDLYDDGMETCKIIFFFKEENIIKVGTDNCWGIYGGYGINWGGKYFREVNH